MGELPDSLRVAFLAGTLGRGGAEKQLVYMARALQAAGVRVRVYTLGQHEFYEVALRDLGLAPTGVGHAGSPLLRLPTFAWALRRFRPHIIQAAHFYVNLYVALASRLFGSLDIGAIRGQQCQDSRRPERDRDVRVRSGLSPTPGRANCRLDTSRPCWAAHSGEAGRPLSRSLGAGPAVYSRTEGRGRRSRAGTRVA